MIIEHKTIELFGEKVFEKVVVSEKLKTHNPLPNEGCFFYILDGINHSISETQNVILKKNEGVLMKCGNYLYQGIPDKKSKQLSFIAIHILPEIIEKIYAINSPILSKNNSTSNEFSNLSAIRANEFIKNYIESILLYFEKPEMINESLMTIKFKEFIELMLHTRNAPEIKHIIQNLFKTNTIAFKEIVKAHIFSEITIEDLAMLTNCSLATFKRKFKEYFNDTPQNYFVNKRLEQSANQLRYSDKNIGEIAFDCLFKNTSHFSTVFNKKYAISPSQYRKSFKQ
ncbi:MAG: helix-turn-helix transcriptional regulator [Flavobacteriales bacterium]|nr:helix-turn-helix transcriptional regulator [Flavobacteriales bacterium]